MNGSPGQGEKAICVLENIVTGGSNAMAVMGANVESALEYFLDVDFQEGTSHRSPSPTLLLY